MTSHVLTDIYWKLVQLNGTPAIVGDAHEAHIILQSNDPRIVGSSGCNRMFGSYELDGDHLTLRPGGMTMMYCSESLMEQERAFVAALSATTSYVIDGETLELRDGDRSLAQFESRGASPAS